MEPFASGVLASSVWRQKINNHQAEGRSEGTHLDDATDPIEIQPPRRDCLTIVLRTQESGEHTPFTSIDDIPLDLNHGAAIVTLVNESAAE